MLVNHAIIIPYQELKWKPRFLERYSRYNTTRMRFELHAKYQPTGDQPQAIKDLSATIKAGNRHQTLLGVTGSGKSLGYSEQVYIVTTQGNKKVANIVKIGELIDSLFFNIQPQVTEDRTEILFTSDLAEDYYTQSYDPKSGTVALYPISAFTRHQTPNRMFTVTTACGRSALVTGDHNFWVLRDGKLQLTKTSEIKLTDHIGIPEKLIQNTSKAKINLLEELKDENLFVEAPTIFKSYANSFGLKKLVDGFADSGLKAPYSRWHAIQHHSRGRGIPIKVMNDLLANTKNLRGYWNPADATVAAKNAAFRLPSEIVLNRAWLKFIGYYLAEGCTQSRYLVIANQQPLIRKKIESIFSNLSISYAVRPSTDYQISSKCLVILFTKLLGRKANSKQLPHFWPNLSDVELGILLQAYFDGDGTVSKNGQIIATTMSQQLASDITYALLRFGIWARIARKWKHASNTDHKGNWYYDISISGQKNLKLFAQNISFEIDYKRDRLHSFLTKVENTNVDLVPGIGSQLFQLRNKLSVTQLQVASHVGINRSALSMIESNKRSPSRKIFKKIIGVFKKLAEGSDNRRDLEASIQKIEKLSSVRWSPIKAVLETPYDYPYVYDFSVPGPETFLAGQGGFFVHNTFTMANVIQEVQKPTLVIAHNKTLAAQLYQEFRDFFPNNAVSYFVSYYDYYQPEAYIPTTDTYIEKEATINDEIDKLRLATTANLLTRPDSIVVASVSCIYNLGSPVEYGKYLLKLVEGELISRETLLLQLSQLQYDRSDTEFRRGTYRLRGDTLQLWPAYEDKALRIETLENQITSIKWIDPVTGSPLSAEEAPEPEEGNRYIIYPAKHYVMDPKNQSEAFAEIRKDLQESLERLNAAGRVVEAYRLQQRVLYDLEMLQEFGYVNGIENYSRYFEDREPGDPPFSLLEYFNANAKEFGDGSFLTIVDESHITLPQIKGMHNGDRARKETLIEYGFRLPSALDNRPLKFEEFQAKTKQMLYVSATPEQLELSYSGENVVEQLIRPTGLVDPNIELRPIDGQIEDLVIEILLRKRNNQRTLVTTLTKKMAEALTEYLNDPKKIKELVERYQTKLRENELNPEKTIWKGDELPIDDMEFGPIDTKYQYHLGIPDALQLDPEDLNYPTVAYLHSDIETLERSDILDDLRRGVYDVVVGINLLREGLDLPEVTLVAILDADKAGFLRSRTSLIQTMGRGARHQEGHAILYADRMTAAMKAAIAETLRRRQAQQAYNKAHGISPQTIVKPIRQRMIKKSDKKAEDARLEEESLQRGMVISLSKTEKVDLNKIKPASMTPDDKKRMAQKLKRRMSQAARELDYELAAILRDKIAELSKAN